MIYYLHGFNSAGYGQKFITLSQMFPREIVLAPTYPVHLPDQAISDLSNSIEHFRNRYSQEKIMLIGSSMGGFYGLWLAQQFQLTCVCINPALDPVETLSPYIGKNTNFYTLETYELSKLQLLETRKYYLKKQQIKNPVLALIDKGDEVINYQQTLQRLPESSEVFLFENGDHRFQHLSEASDIISSFYIK